MACKIELASCFCTAASPGLFAPNGRGSWTASSCAVFDASSTSSGREKSQITRSWSSPEFPACTLCRSRDVCAGLDIFVRISDGLTPKHILYGELVQGKRPTGRPLRYKDVCKRDLKALGTDLNRWETLASDRVACWKRHLSYRLKQRDKGGRVEARGTDQWQTTSVPSVETTATTLWSSQTDWCQS